MADILSLKRARKAKERTEKESAAAANRTKFGRTKVEKHLDDAGRALAAKKLDAHKRKD